MTALIVCLFVLGVVGLVCWVVAEGLAWLEHELTEREARVQRVQRHVQQEQEQEWRRARAGYERALRDLSTLEDQTRQRLTEPVAPTRRYDPNCAQCRAERAAWQVQRGSRREVGR